MLLYCSKCGLVKQHTEFYNIAVKQGHGICKECQKAVSKLYNNTHKEEIKERRARNRRKKRELTGKTEISAEEYARKWLAKHPMKMALMRKQMNILFEYWKY